tara:strand:+ start:136 stop:255 length:120 start_codon:yes stop_codon:yes gene_type:complete
MGEMGESEREEAKLIIIIIIIIIINGVRVREEAKQENIR